MRSVGLFAGIGGFEVGLQRADIDTELLCEYWEPAAAVLTERFGADIAGDIRDLEALPSVDVVTAGFPCTDLSQVGRTAGIDGRESGLVREALRLIEQNPPRWVVLENVPNMLGLGGGAAISAITGWLEDRGWNWAYRTVDSQHFGLRQRRRRVFLVASRTQDPRAVLFADEFDGPGRTCRHRSFGFSWTEGNRGIGWGPGVTPTLKGGSKWGIASPPAVWNMGGEPGSAIVKPSITAGERLQGFRSGWTDGLSEGVRWKLVGNAVSVPVAGWIAGRLVDPGTPVDVGRRTIRAGRWPAAAANVGGTIEAWALGESPLHIRPRLTLGRTLDAHGSEPLSRRATVGFSSRLERSSLRYNPDFMLALKSHAAVLA